MEAHAQGTDSEVIGHSGKDIKPPKVGVVDFNYSPINSSQDKGIHLQVHLKCPQHHLEQIQSCGWHLSALLTDLILAHPGDPL